MIRHPAARIAILLALLALANGAALSAQSSSSEPEYRFSTGDALRVIVWGDADLSGDFQIMPDGRLAHPLLQELLVEGRTFSEVKADVLEYVSQYHKNPRVIVTPLLRIAVGGLAVAPGVKGIDPRATLLELVGIAGGPQFAAKFGWVDVVRGGQKTRHRLWGPEASQPTLLELGLRSGDQVLIPERKTIWSNYIVPVITISGSLVTFATFIQLITR